MIRAPEDGGVAVYGFVITNPLEHAESVMEGMRMQRNLSFVPWN
jgi:hypothetical protein